MANILISQANADELMRIRRIYGSKGKRNRAGRDASRAIFRKIKQEAGLPQSKKIVVFIENKDNPLYRVIRDKFTKLPLDDGRGHVPVIVEAKKEPAKKGAAAKKAPAKKVAPKTVKAAPAKKVAQAAKKAVPAKKTTKVAAPSKDLYDTPKDVRISVNGKRVYIGKAKSDADKAKMIAKYKKANNL